MPSPFWRRLYCPVLTALVRQQALTVVLPVRHGERAELERALEAMRAELCARFGGVESLHFARFAVIPERTGAEDARLLFESSFDGTFAMHSRELRRELGAELDRLLEHCEPALGATGFEARFRLGARRAAAFFSAHRGRSAREIKDDGRLRAGLARFLKQERASLLTLAPGAIVERARVFLGLGRCSGARSHDGPGTDRGGSRSLLVEAAALAPMIARAALSDVSDVFHALWTDQRLDAGGLDEKLAQLTPRAGTQQALTHVVELKPGRFRRRALAAALRFVDAWFRSHPQARFGTSHFARFVDLGDGRLAFLSHHDGSLEAALGALVERSATLATLVWSHTQGFPASLGPLVGGARDESRFKHWARVKCLPAPVVYGAYPELSLLDVRRGAELRAILAGHLDDARARRALELV